MSNKLLDSDCCHDILNKIEDIEKIHYPFLENNLSDQEKIETIEYHFKHILQALGMNLADDSLRKTPYRYAKMFVQELFQGLNDKNFPSITTQDNKFHYNQPLIESHISIQSVCEHHFVPILGYCHIAYIPKDRVIGLSKLNRVAKYFARRPQVQERLTKQICTTLCEILETPDVAVVIDALHLCVRMRGIQDQNALTRTMDLGGIFSQNPARDEFLSLIPKLSEMKI
jgi:GTP cyclohydrolase I